MSAYVLLLFCLGLATTIHAQCPRPEGYENMLLSPTTFPAPEGSQATFKCEVGYRPTRGSGTIACSQGRWTTLMMRCEIITCGSAGEVLNGNVDYSQGSDFGAEVKTVCNSGYTVVGVENRMYCGVQGWMGRLGECEAIICDAPPPIANGNISPEREEYQTHEVITYSCQGDYVLNITGSPTSVCTEEGVFDKPTPKCVLVQCENPTIANGVQASGSRPPYKYMTFVTMRCNNGYKIEGEGQGNAKCGIDSKWKPPLPKCTPIECKAPQIKNGEVVDGPRLSYKFQESVELKCIEGYKQSGPSTVSCVAENEWSPKLPECNEIICNTPEVKDGKVVGSPRPSYKYSESVEFECNTGYERTGPSTAKCDQNRQWAPSLPQCTLIPTKPTVISTKPTSPPGNGGHVKEILLSVLGVLGAAIVGVCIYCGILKKKKRGSGKPNTESTPEAESLRLS